MGEDLSLFVANTAILSATRANSCFECAVNFIEYWEKMPRTIIMKGSANIANGIYVPIF